MVEKSVIRAVSIPKELANRLLKFAHDNRRPISWVAQDAIKEYLDRNEKPTNQDNEQGEEQ